MKLKHIHIDNYKLFRDFDIDFCDGEKPLTERNHFVSLSLRESTESGKVRFWNTSGRKACHPENENYEKSK